MPKKTTTAPDVEEASAPDEPKTEAELSAERAAAQAAEAAEVAAAAAAETEGRVDPQGPDFEGNTMSVQSLNDGYAVYCRICGVTVARTETAAGAEEIATTWQNHKGYGCLQYAI